MYAQMKQQLANAESAIKSQRGTIETLERQLVQAGIKDKLNESSKVMDKELNRSVAAQRLIRSRMQDKEKIQQENVDNDKNVQ